MRYSDIKRPLLAALMSGSLAACGVDATAPATVAAVSDDVSPSALVLGYGVTAMAAVIDASGIGGADFPPALALSTEQKADVIKLQLAFDNANSVQVARLRAIEDELRAATRAGKPRAERVAIRDRGLAVRGPLDASFSNLQSEIQGLYTKSQRDWVNELDPVNCVPTHGGLTDEQIAAIRALHEAFNAAVAELRALIQQVVAEARAAWLAGASWEEIRAILAQADEARQQIAVLERRLRQAINAIINSGQGGPWCEPVRGLGTVRP